MELNELISLQRLHQYGHLDELIPYQNIRRLHMEGPEVTAAIASYHAWFEQEMDELCLTHHRRPLNQDRLYGPALEQLLSTPRCGRRDIPSATDIDEANIPVACRMNATESFSFSLPGLSAEQTTAIFESGAKNWADRIKVRMRRIASGAMRPIILANLGGSTLADQTLPRNSCSDRLPGRFNGSFTWSIARSTATETHELGHFFGLRHERTDRAAIMWPSIHQAGMARGGTPNASDVRQAVALGYDLADDEPPPPDGGGEQYFMTGHLVHSDGTREPRTLTANFQKL